MGNSIIRFKRKQHFFVVPGLMGCVTFVFFFKLLFFYFILFKFFKENNIWQSNSEL